MTLLGFFFIKLASDVQREPRVALH
jgi:hypothetical protein